MDLVKVLSCDHQLNRPSFSHIGATGNHQYETAYVIRKRRSQKEHWSSSLVGCTWPAEGDHLLKRFPRCLRNTDVDLAFVNSNSLPFFFYISETRLNEAIGHGIDVDIESAPLPCQCFRHADDAHFCCGVVDLT